MLQALRCCHSLFDLECEHLQDQVFRVGRDFGQLGDVECVKSRLDLLHDLVVVLRVERGDTREQDVEDDAERPDIALFVVPLVDDFRGDVVGLGEWRVRCRASSRGTGVG